MAGLADRYKETGRHKASLPLSTREKELTVTWLTDIKTPSDSQYGLSVFVKSAC